MNKLLSDEEDEETRLYLSRKHVVVQIGQYKVISRLLEGEFLDYKAAIPAGSNSTVTVDVRPLIDSIERTSLLIDLYFDVGWNRTGAQDAIYTVTVLCAGQRMVLPGGGEIAPAPTGREDYFSAVVAVWNEKGEILQIPVEKYLG